VTSVAFKEILNSLKRCLAFCSNCGCDGAPFAKSLNSRINALQRSNSLDCGSPSTDSGKRSSSKSRCAAFRLDANAFLSDGKLGQQNIKESNLQYGSRERNH